MFIKIRGKALVILLLLRSALFAGNPHYLVLLKDKNGSRYNSSRPLEFLSSAAILRRQKQQIPVAEKDFPPNATYLSAIQKTGRLKLLGSSRWLNAVHIECGDSNTLQALASLPFVSLIRPLGRYKETNRERPASPEPEYYSRARALRSLKQDSLLPAFQKADYHNSYAQNGLIGIPGLHRAGIKRGENYHIAVFDAGFHKAYRISGMEDLLDSSTVVRDFVDHDNSVWEDDPHGCNVLGFMKTYHPGFYIGSAPFARYTLIRTEDAGSESPIEELNWLLAAELADSLGADMISASVGYHAFDDSSLSYSIEQLDGHSSLIAFAANEASARGMVVVCSAGNEGNNSWGRIGTPADAFGSIAIGACDENGMHARFSSYGPTADGRIKPDFLVPGYKVRVASAYGTYNGNGTSYATPIFAGALAGLISLFPEKSISDVLAALRFSACHSLYPDTAYGYGVPDFELAMAVLGRLDSAELQKDLLWSPEFGTAFRDMNLHFRSGRAQTVKILIRTPKGKRQKTIYRSQIRLSAGQWLHHAEIMRLLNSKVKKKHPYKELILDFETDSISYRRTFRKN